MWENAYREYRIRQGSLGAGADIQNIPLDSEEAQLFRAGWESALYNAGTNLRPKLTWLAAEISQITGVNMEAKMPDRGSKKPVKKSKQESDE